LEILKGVPVSPGVVIGKALVLGAEKSRVPERFVRKSGVAKEIKRFNAALGAARKDVEALAAEAAQEIGEGAGSIFDAHIWILSDKALQKDISERIERNRFTAEYAVSRAFRRYQQAFRSIKDKYLAERIHDVQDVEQRLLATLMGSRRIDLSLLEEPVVIVAHDLTPSQTASLQRDKVLGFAVDLGGPTSHSAILARALEIPAVVGVEQASAEVSSGDQVVIDGNRGLVVLKPDRKTLTRYRKAAKQFAKFEAELAKEADLPAVAPDGLDYKVFANMEFPEEIDSILEHGADGVGLFRTEFLYLRKGELPSEDEHYEAYCSVARKLEGRPLVIRTFDLGADKVVTENDVPTREQNPFLGCRSIRLSQYRPEIFRTQIRAIMRAAAEYKNIEVMLPMITVQGELTWAKELMNEVRENLKEEKHKLPGKLKIGIMVEVPSTALQAHCFAGACDFFSIGTNDLIQYTLAVDRTNPTVAGLYNPAHPAVLQLIRTVIKAGGQAGIPVAMCGEMAGDPLYTVLLVGLGLREFSITPSLVPELKKIIRSVRQDRARELARELENCVVPDAVISRLRKELEDILPGAGAPVDGMDFGT
jgi:phosphoenolpyruvate-protein phosphotransferase (PTS system enzyme I)